MITYTLGVTKDMIKEVDGGFVIEIPFDRLSVQLLKQGLSIGNITKDMLVSMVKGSDPYYTAFEHPLIKRAGYWTGGHVDKWSWRDLELKDMTENELAELYTICRDSWPRR